MAGQTKMIIITSNEDIIRQFALNKAVNTHIIALDDDKQEASTRTDDNNMVNLALLAELSKLNSTNDHVFKRALDLPQHDPSKPVKASKKSNDFVCAICSDYAIGFNYDVPSCASCKAFFRRNANQNMERLRCLTGQGQCSVAHGTRRKCQKCRLERCFAAGMRKDFILSEEEKQRKRERLEENRNIASQRLSISESTNTPSVPQSTSNSESLSPISDEIDHLMTMMAESDGNIILDENENLNQIGDVLWETLSVEDWMTIESLRSSFTSIFQNDVAQHPSLEVSDRTSALISWSYIANQNALNFITFCRKIAEFESLDADDRLILIKYNLFPVYPILKCFYFNPKTFACSNDDNGEAAKHQRFYTLCFGSEGIRDAFMNLTLSLVELTEQDPAILSLLLTILMFYQGLSMDEDEPSLKDSLTVYRAQSYFTKLLWNYMSNKWGEIETWRRFSQLLTVIFRMKSSAKMFRDYFRAQFTTTDTIEKIAPLMQTVLHIS